jgi:hypothetical protein
VGEEALDAFFGGALRVPSLYFKVKTHGLTFVRRTRMVFSKNFFLEHFGGVAFGEPLL